MELKRVHYFYSVPQAGPGERKNIYFNLFCFQRHRVEIGNNNNNTIIIIIIATRNNGKGFSNFFRGNKRNDNNLHRDLILCKHKSFNA